MDIPGSGYQSFVNSTPRPGDPRFSKPDALLPFDPKASFTTGHKRIAPKIITASDLSSPLRKKMHSADYDSSDCTIDPTAARMAATALNLSIKAPQLAPTQLTIPMQMQPHLQTAHHHQQHQQQPLATPPTQVQRPIETVKMDCNGTLDLSMKSNKGGDTASTTTHSTPSPSSVQSAATGLIQLSVPQPGVQNPVPTFITSAPTILQIPRNYGEQPMDFSAMGKQHPVKVSKAPTSVVSCFPTNPTTTSSITVAAMLKTNNPDYDDPR